MFWMDFGFRENRHEISVPCPSRNNMIVNMFIVTRAGAFPQIESHIETIGIVYVAENLDTIISKRSHFSRLIFIQSRNTSKVAMRRDHKVTVIIWEYIHQYKAVFSLKKDEMFFIISRFWKSTENAFTGLIFNNVFHAPRRPNAFHKMLFNHWSIKNRRIRQVSCQEKSGGINRGFFPSFDELLYQNAHGHTLRGEGCRG